MSLKYPCKEEWNMYQPHSFGPMVRCAVCLWSGVLSIDLVAWYGTEVAHAYSNLRTIVPFPVPRSASSLLASRALYIGPTIMLLLCYLPQNIFLGLNLLSKVRVQYSSPVNGYTHIIMCNLNSCKILGVSIRWTGLEYWPIKPQKAIF